MNYAQDYIGQLCRSGKLDCTMVGRSWFVTEESLLSHRENAIDGTQDRIIRSSKIAEASQPIVAVAAPIVDQKEVGVQAPVLAISQVLAQIIETKIEIPKLSPVLSPIQNFTYEAENKPLLPELKKAVPSPFALPKNSKNVLSVPSVIFTSKNERKVSLRVVKTPTPKKSFGSPTPVLALPSGVSVPVSTLSLRMIPHASQYTTLAITLVALGGFFFTLSIATFQNTRSVSYNQASVSSATGELFSEVLKSLGLRGRAPSTVAARPAAPATADTSLRPGDMNGIGIFPAVNPTEDEAAKARIINSFSDEVTISPDQSGSAGVITPVFKKTNGEDFVYVLVPVNQQKK